MQPKLILTSFEMYLPPRRENQQDRDPYQGYDCQIYDIKAAINFEKTVIDQY